ncbi:MAG: H-NS family nucleoid-associated regulatory protein [Endozoicomonas sp. (ex Botrylloides leachii)]|nr:H-NS family nucleoid-associated regulatory protein [Endozoicomonas sp. (ex Botrylloides leachii)]
MNIFEEALDVLKSKVQLRKLFQDMHAEDLQRIINRLDSIYEEKLLLQQEQEKEQSRKREAIEAVLNQMKELGVKADDIESLIGSAPMRKHKPRKRYVFSYQAKDGNDTNWEGATTGRIPAEFSDYLKRTGKDRKDCIISELD